MKSDKIDQIIDLDPTTTKVYRAIDRCVLHFNMVAAGYMAPHRQGSAQTPVLHPQPSRYKPRSTKPKD